MSDVSRGQEGNGNRVPRGFAKASNEKQCNRNEECLGWTYQKTMWLRKESLSLEMHLWEFIKGKIERKMREKTVSKNFGMSTKGTKCV